MEQSLNYLRKEKDHVFYGQVNANQPPSPTLVFQLKNGNYFAFGYHYLAKQMQYNPSTGIHLSFIDPDSSTSVHIQGRHLLPLWDALVWHKVTFIKELDTPLDEYPESDLCVTSITISNME